jgi:hypothetical protein
MKKINTQFPLTVVLGLVITGSLFHSSETFAQQIARMRIDWNFTAGGGALYLNICDNPRLRTNPNTGGCATVNVLNSNVTSNREGTRLVEDRLRVGTEYKACIVADNIDASHQGRWMVCRNFIAADQQAVSLPYQGLWFVRSKP